MPNIQRTLSRSLSLVALLLALTELLSAQDTFHVFPQVADGRFSDGSFYRSTITVLPLFEGDAPQCVLTLFGMSAAFAGGSSSSSFSFNVAAGGVAAMQTTGNQAFQSGYGTLTCSTNVFANMLYSFYASEGGKLGEATIFSSSQSIRFRMVADHREGARLGIAIANNTDNQQGYVVTYAASGGGSVSTTVTVPARRSVARFLDEMTPVAADSVGVVSITSPTLSNFSVIGLRFTGVVFTTIPPN
jgi:hypothetical protein